MGETCSARERSVWLLVGRDSGFRGGFSGPRGSAPTVMLARDIVHHGHAERQYSGHAGVAPRAKCEPNRYEGRISLLSLRLYRWRPDSSKHRVCGKPRAVQFGVPRLALGNTSPDSPCLGVALGPSPHDTWCEDYVATRHIPTLSFKIHDDLVALLRRDNEQYGRIRQPPTSAVLFVI